MLLLLGLSSFLPLSPVAAAEESTQEPLADKLMIRGGWAYVFGANIDVTLPGVVSGVGTTLDFTKTLGGRTSTDAFRIDTLYRFNERHALGFSYYRVGLGAEKNLNEQINIRDHVINAGANTQSSFNLNLYRLLYNYSFYHTDKVEIAISPGLYMANLKFSLSAQGTINGVTGNGTQVVEKLTLPLPSVGLALNYNILPQLQFQTRSDFFYLNVGKYQGSMFEFYAGLEYRLVKHLALGVAYDRLITGLDSTSSDGYEFALSYNLAYLYASLYF